MKHFTGQEIERICKYESFVSFLRDFYTKDVSVPDRPHYRIPAERSDATLLLMPAWEVGGYTGIKIASVYPQNAHHNLPSVQGVYILMDANNGQILATMDGTVLTLKRTAAVSALASTCMSHKDTNILMMIGTGQLSGELVRAHGAVRPLKKVYVWGRNYAKAKAKSKEIENSLPDLSLLPIMEKDKYIPQCDLISVATLSKSPLVNGNLLKSGAHLDLVGSFTPEMREADDDCVKRSSIFVDTYNAIKESGDIAIPIQSGLITESYIKMDLKELVKNGYQRKSSSENTYFKSVGNAQSDLALAVYIYEYERQST